MVKDWTAVAGGFPRVLMSLDSVPPVGDPFRMIFICLIVYQSTRVINPSC